MVSRLSGPTREPDCDTETNATKQLAETSNQSKLFRNPFLKLRSISANPTPSCGGVSVSTEASLIRIAL
jgi:hypothetical protein